MKTASFFTLLGMTFALVPNALAEDATRTDLLGKKTIIHNSVAGWNYEVATVTTAYDDGSVRVKLGDGRTARVPAHNIEVLLSMPTRCGESHGAEICVNDKVYYPNSAVSIGVPEGTVEEVFTNGYALVRDGDLRVFRLSELGIEESLHCSSAKPEICKNDRVRAEKIVGRESFEFEGRVVKLYTNGVALVENGPKWKQSVSVAGITKREDVKQAVRAPRGLASVMEVYEEDSVPTGETKEDIDYYLPVPGFEGGVR